MVVYDIGDVIGEFSPFAHCVNGDDRDIRCHYCLELRNTLRLCSSCKVARYCSKECQTKDWKSVHQSECKVFSRASRAEKSFLLSETHYRLILRVILILKKFPEKEYQEVETIKGPRSFSSLSGDGERLFSFSTKVSTYINIMRRTLENLSVNIESSKLKEIFAKVLIHSTDIPIVLDGIGGKGLYVGTSGFDHSCMPNSVRCISHGLNMKIRAMKRIDTRYEPPVITYIDDRLPFALRRTILNMCMITCDCPRCLFPCSEFDREIMERRTNFNVFMGIREFGLDFFRRFFE